MQIKNYNKALKNKKYYVQINVEDFISSQLGFWQEFLKNSELLSSQN
jgi:hypothetical protein